MKRTITKYENRRLYDPSTKKYLKLPDLGKVVRDGHEVTVLTYKEGQDLTHVVLLQVLLETDGEKPVLDAESLHKIIRHPDRARKLITKALAEIS